MNFGLSKITLNELPEVLLLGLGGGCVVESLEIKYQIQCEKIIAVEIDSVVIRLALEEFKLDRFKELEIIQEDALVYVQNYVKQFDLVIVDLFIDDIVPESFYSIGFWKDIYEQLKSNGKVIFNAGMSLGISEKIENIKSILANQIDFIQYEKVQQINTVLIGCKINPSS